MWGMTILSQVKLRAMNWGYLMVQLLTGRMSENEMVPMMAIMKDVKLGQLRALDWSILQLE